MPRIVGYTEVLDATRALQLRSLYYNSGAFGFEDGIDAKSVGWICAEDSSLRPEARQLARLVPGPAELTLPRLLTRAIAKHLPAPVWVMPKSHWAFELDCGRRAWMAHALQEIGIDPRVLEPLATGDAIEFDAGEVLQFAAFTSQLLINLTASDFALGFPGRPVVCTLHHHKQVWWTTNDLKLLHSLEQLAA